MIEQSRSGFFGFLDRRAVQRLLDACLPKNAHNVRYLRWRPSTDLAYQEALICWDCPQEEYLEFVRARALTLLSVSGPNVHLPSGWQPAPEIPRPDWWEPSSDTPPDAASGTVGTFGSIIAKWEAGRVYVLITDTGHRGPG